jgi:4-amino-4-deoxy-L-arabinose transferase-like glycosyltransferase
VKKESLIDRFINLFRYDGKIDPVILTLCLVINIIVLTNAILHYPKIGYDVVQDLNYIQVLPDRLPTFQDTYEFFSPPLPYFLPSRFDVICEQHAPDALQNYNGLSYSNTCRLYDGKFAQGLNVLLSIGTTILLLMVAEQIKPGKRFFRISALMMLALLTVYYKTFSQVRAEPYVIFFIALSIYLINEILKTTSLNYKLIVATGITLGLLVLSRQWGFFIFPAIFLLIIWIFIQDRQIGWLRIRQFFLITFLSAMVGGWFYVHLYLDYGTFSAFNIKKPKYSSVIETLSFLRQTGLGNLELFDKPVRPVFDRQSFFGIMYSETWGDYWGYFTYIKPGFASNGTGNYASMAPYLGRVNLVSIFPSLLLFGGFLFGVIQIFQLRKSLTLERTSLVFITLLALSTVLGYLWFVYRYFMQTNLVIKATYAIQLFIALLFLFAGLMEVIRNKSQFAYNLILFLLTLVFIYDLPAMITRYSKVFGY